MSLRSLIKAAAILGLLGLASVGCGSSDESKTTASYTCCLNGSFYNCPSSDAESKCTLTNGPGECVSDTSKNSTCGK